MTNSHQDPRPGPALPDPPAPIRALDARYYTDPQVFEVERQGLLARTWQFGCHVSELAGVGAYASFEIAGESLFAIRGRDGKIRVFYSVCQHRAHQLVAGSGTTRVVVCPYHAWTYELTGVLRAGPNLGAVEGFDRSRICLTEVRSEEFLGFLFVNLDPEAQPMEHWFPNARAELEEWVPNWAELRPLDWVEIPERCNWKVSVENYSECDHCSLCHPTFARGVGKPQSYDIRSGFAHFDQYSSWFLWPMFSFQVYPGNVLNTYHWRVVDAAHVVLWRGYVPGPLVVDPKGGVNSEHPVMHLQRWMREGIEA